VCNFWDTQIQRRDIVFMMRKTRNSFFSKDVIFLESFENDKIIERQLDHLDNFTRVKTYHEFDDEIPHLEGGILNISGISF
jgi:hypothetical protein